VHAIDLSSEGIARSSRALAAVEHGLEVMSAVRECMKRLKDSGAHLDASDTVSIVLVEIGGYDCVILWRVEGSAPVPVSAACADPRRPSVSELLDLMSMPPSLEDFGVDAAVCRDVDLAATASLGSDRPMDPAMARWSWAAAAVTARSYPTFVLQAFNSEHAMDDADRDLLLSFAQLSAALITEPGATELHRRSRAWTRARSHTTGDHGGWWFKATTDEPRHDALDAVLDTLTIRQREVLAHALTGATYEAIADALFVSPATVKSHMQSILRKLGVHSRAQLIARFGPLSADS
jgi:DNA-binding CsgD family transcriptional regulator